ncbi:MAG: hypothetical protein AABW65_01820 [Nanoarchaeota archaeon]
MIEENIIINLAPWLSSYIYLLSFLAPIIGGGELGVIAVSFIFSSNLQNFLIIFFFSSLGMLVIDSIWFFISKSKLFFRLKNWSKIKNKYSIIEKNIEKISQKKDWIIILLAKLMIGTRILLILYLGGRKISYWNYLKYNLFPNFFWGLILVFAGFLASRGFTGIIKTLHDIQLAVTFLIVFFVTVYTLQKWMSEKLMRELNR